MYDWVTDTPLEGYVQDAPREELGTVPVDECLATNSWQKYHQ